MKCIWGPVDPDPNLSTDLGSTGTFHRYVALHCETCLVITGPSDLSHPGWIQDLSWSVHFLVRSWSHLVLWLGFLVEARYHLRICPTWGRWDGAGEAPSLLARVSNLAPHPLGSSRWWCMPWCWGFLAPAGSEDMVWPCYNVRGALLLVCMMCIQRIDTELSLPCPWVFIGLSDNLVRPWKVFGCLETDL